MNTKASVILAVALVLSAVIFSSSIWFTRERYKFAVVEYDSSLNGQSIKPATKSLIKSDSYTGRAWEYTSSVYAVKGETPIVDEKWKELKNFNSAKP